MTAQAIESPPRDNLIRAYAPGFELRVEGDDGGMPVLAGRFTVYGEWTEIDSVFEGRFLERLAPGSGKKTIRENRDDVRVLFQHGRDPQIGDKPLGPIRELRDEPEGPTYEVPLLDTDYNRELIPGLEAGLYGASFRMQVLREEWADDPGRSEHNPDGLPERTIKEYRLFEFGPVTFPAYKSATAGLRSLTDDFVFEWLAREPQRARELLGAVELRSAAFAAAAPSDPGAAPERTPGEERRGQGEAVAAPSESDAGQTPTSDPERRDPQERGRYGLAEIDQRPSWAL